MATRFHLDSRWTTIGDDLCGQSVRVLNPIHVILLGMGGEKLVELSQRKRWRQRLPLGDRPQKIVMVAGVDRKNPWKRRLIDADEFAPAGGMLDEPAPVGHRRQSDGIDAVGK